MEPEIIQYIKDSRQHGLSDKEIRQHLINAGWDPAIVDTNISLAQNPPTQNTAVPEINDKIVTMVAPDLHATPPTQSMKPEAIVTPAQTQTPVTTAIASTTPKSRKKLILWVVISLVIALFIAALVSAYLLIGLGKTVFGKNLANQAWQRLIDKAGTQLADRNITVEYTDHGTFSFSPAQFLKDLNVPEISSEVNPTELDKIDKALSFQLKDLATGFDAGGYFNAQNPDKPKVKTHLGVHLTNQGTDYSFRLDFKLKDLLAYFKYDLSDTIQTFIKERSTEFAKDSPYQEETKQINDKIAEWNDKWLKADVTESDLKDFGKGLQDGLNFNPLGNAQSRSRDARRFADISQFRSALELYLNDKGSYPDSLSQLMPTYLGTIPVAPKPADGKCTEDGNTYAYKKVGEQDYELTFCLGEANSYSTSSVPGMNKLSASGVNAYTCPSERSCLKTAADSANQSNPYKEIFKQNRIFTIKSFKGVSKVGDTWTLHYSLALDKPKIKTIILDSVKESMGADEYNKNDPDTKKAREYLEGIVDWWVNNLNFKDWEVWVGVSDQNIYKIHIDEGVPSVIGTANWAYKETTQGSIKYLVFQSLRVARSKSRDAKRLADMRQMESALELFFNDHGGYPEAKQGKPQSITPEYLYEVPIQPVPEDGKCTDFYNTYWYTPKDPAGETTIKGKVVHLYKDYSYTFCLGAETGGHEAGNTVMSASGIKSLTECKPGRPCYKDVAVPEQVVADNKYENMTEEQLLDEMIKGFKALPWDANLSWQFEAKDYNKDLDIEAPADATDVKTLSANSSNNTAGMYATTKNISNSNSINAFIKSFLGVK